MNHINYFITCEHAGNRVPDELSDIFSSAGDVLETHRGYDIGAMAFAARLASDLVSPFFYSEITRLVVDLNRSESSRSLFSEFTSGLDETEKKQILEKYYYPYRNRVEGQITGLVSANSANQDSLYNSDNKDNQYIPDTHDTSNDYDTLSRSACSDNSDDMDEKVIVIHIAVHSFTPVLNGKTRNAEIGLLYDPRRIPEKKFCSMWKDILHKYLPEFRTRKNYPYKGTSDCLPMKLKKSLEPENYIGIELEINQDVFADKEMTGRLYDGIFRSLEDLKEDFKSVFF